MFCNFSDTIVKFSSFRVSFISYDLQRTLLFYGKSCYEYYYHYHYHYHYQSEE